MEGDLVRTLYQRFRKLEYRLYVIKQKLNGIDSENNISFEVDLPVEGKESLDERTLSFMVYQITTMFSKIDETEKMLQYEMQDVPLTPHFNDNNFIRFYWISQVSNWIRQVNTDGESVTESRLNDVKWFGIAKIGREITYEYNESVPVKTITGTKSDKNTFMFVLEMRPEVTFNGDVDVRLTKELVTYIGQSTEEITNPPTPDEKGGVLIKCQFDKATHMLWAVTDAVDFVKTSPLHAFINKFHKKDILKTALPSFSTSSDSPQTEPDASTDP